MMRYRDLRKTYMKGTEIEELEEPWTLSIPEPTPRYIALNVTSPERFHPVENRASHRARAQKALKTPRVTNHYRQNIVARERRLDRLTKLLAGEAHVSKYRKGRGTFAC